MFSLFPSEETSSVQSTALARGLRAGRMIVSILGAVSLFGAPLRGSAATPVATDAPTSKGKLVESYGKVPLSFEPNRGQTSPAVQWVARGPEYALFLSGHDAVLELNSITPPAGITDRPKIYSSAVRMNLLGATTALKASGERQQAGTANYFTGSDPAKWQHEVPNFEKVRLSGVYPGIDLVYYGRQGRLEYDFVVAPGADASKIMLKFDGAEARLAANGDLILPVAGTAREIRFDKPTVYQLKDGHRQPVEGAFQIANDRTVSFALGSYDRLRELVIDPTLLFAGSIATGNQQTIPAGMTIDASGAMYVTGYTNDLTFPVTTGALQTNCQTYSAAAAANGFVRCGPSSSTSGFVTKISPDGTSLIYSTYLHGGGGQESGGAITVDAQGDAYVLGATSSNDFPITSNAYQSLCQPAYSSGAYFAPVLPITAQCDNFANGGGTEYTVNGPNLFIAELNPSGTALLYSTFFGGSQAAYPVGIALDAASNIYFASEVNLAQSPSNLYPNNTQLPFPTTASGYQTTGNNLLTPAFSELSADGQTLLYSTFLGSLGTNGHDTYNSAFALGKNGVAFIGGYTAAADFPTTPASVKPACTLNTSDGSYCFTSQGFVAAIDTTKIGAASLVYSSYLGGDEQQGSNIPEQQVYGLAADANNNLFVTGYTSANDFPSTAGVYQPHCNDVNPAGNCNQTAFLSKINPAGSALTWSTFLGDTRDDGPGGYGASIAFDAKGQVYLYGLSDDGSGSFPQVDPISTYTSGNKVFIATFSADASKLLFSTRFSGPANNAISLAPSANGLAVDAAGSMYIVGYTGDGGSFGTTTGTYSTTATNGFNRPFFAKISRVTGQSATTLAIAPSPAASGQTIAFSASVTGDGSSTAIPSGTVTVTASGVSPTPTVLGTITLDGTGNGTFSTNTLGSGTYSVQAAYSGDANYEPSLSAAQTLTVTASLTQNLLQNPGAELGSLADWTIGGAGTPIVDNGTYDSGINPHTGSYDFVGGYSSGTDSLSQTVSIVAQGTGITAAQVDGGTLFANVSFWEQGLSQGTPSDDGSVSLTFLDGNNATLSTVTTSIVDSHNGAWTNGTGTYAIPAGTRSITYVMNFLKNQLTDNDAFFDDNSLSIGTSTGLTLFPGSLHFGNVAVGDQSAPQTVTVTNQQATTINIVQIMSELGANPLDFVQTNTCPAALTAGASCQVTVTFVPDGVGPKVAGIDLPDDSSPDDQYILVDGTGTGGILQVNPGNLKTIAGNGTKGDTGDGGPAIAAELNQPNGVAFDPSGNLYIADDVANVVRRVDTSGNITTIAGTGTNGFTGDGGPAVQAELSQPFSVASDAAGNIYIQDTGNYVVRKVTAATGIITTYAGTPGVPGHSGDGGPATAAKFNNNQGARFDSAGNFYVPTCRGASIRKIDTAGNISTVAGNFTEGYSGDGGQATAAQLQCPSGVAIDPAGNLYIADASNNVIRKVTAATGIISTIAGSTAGTAGSSGDGGAATAALLSLPNDVALDGVGNLYIADSANNRVRKIDVNGNITTAAGGLNNAGSAAVNTPLGLTTDNANNVYFSDSGNGKVQEIFPQGTQPFPATLVGTTSAAQSLTLSNIGNTNVTLSANGAFTTSGNAGDFALTPGSCGGGAVLTANGGSCAVSITFTPTAVGQRTLTVMLADDALNTPQSFSIGGMGVAPAGQMATPTIMWAMPAAITTATPLSATQLDAMAADANGNAVPGTFVYTPAAGAMLGAGTQTLSVTFTPTDTTDFTTATGSTTIVVTQASGATGSATTTVLTVSVGEGAVTTVAAGTVVALTATVSGGDTLVSPGQVAFCDATAATCTDNHLLGTAQLTSAGTAIYRFVPGIGTHSYKAVFLGTPGGRGDFAGSASAAAPLAVTGKFPSVTTIAQSGAAGSYTVTATTVGIGDPTAAPVGTVSFLDSSNSNALLITGTLGAGTPGLSFAGQTSAANMENPQTRSAVADFNGDGILDIATASTAPASDPTQTIYANTVTISLGKGDGTFTPLNTYPATGSHPQSIVSGDFNGDGKADLAVTNNSDGTVTILIGNGDGTFAAGTTVAAARGAYGLVAGDFNGDGNLDLAVSTTNDVVILLGNGDGTFVASQIDISGGTTEAFGPIITADFNGDGKADLIVEGFSPAGELVVLLGNGDGTFAAGPPITLPGQGSNLNGLVAGDFNGDGKVDFAATNSSQNAVLIMTGNGDGTFVMTAAASGTDYDPVDIQAGDFNGDGKLDLAVQRLTYNGQEVLLGNGDGTFTIPVIPTGVYAYDAVAVGDFNGDGVPDLAGTDGSANLQIALTQRTDTAVVAATPVPALSAGTHQVVASFPGDATYSASVSSATSLTGGGAAAAVTPTITWPMPAAITTATPLSAAQLDATATDANGAAVPGTYAYTPGPGTLLQAGTQTLSVTFTPDDTTDFTAATGTTAIVVTAATASGGTGTPTMTALYVTSHDQNVTTVTAGSVVTLSAQLLAGENSVSPAQVAFCDATALSCTGSHLLGIAQVTEGGTANLSFVPGVGVHTYSAVFLGTNLYSGSSSAAATLTVTGTIPTTTAVAQSGTAGNISLTAMTVGANAYSVSPATQSATINLGQSAQNYVLTGTGASTVSGSNYGNYYNTQGSCVTAGLITTCDLTGTFTSSTPAYAAGTYDFQTVFTGSVTSAINSQTQYPVGTEPNDFQYSAFAPSTTMTLKLNVTGGGSYAIPLVANGNYVSSLDGIGFANTSVVCGGTSLGSLPCQEDNVGTVAGATFSGPVTGSVEFEMPSLPALTGPTGAVSFLDTSNANAVLGTSVLGAAAPGFALAQAAGPPATAGTHPYGVATGDFNNDGFADVVIENYSSNTVSVLLGKGDGTFQAPVTYAVGSLPERVLVADMDGDGNLDLIVANTGSNSISILLGVGNGTFRAQTTYPCNSPVGLGVMDVNHDGIPDVVAGNYYSNTMSVLLGKGDGTLNTAVTYATGSTPQTVAEGDFNGDGIVDVVVGNEGAATVGVFLGNGDGTFQTMVTYPVGNSPQGVQVGDFNGDGKQDLAVSNQVDGTVSVLLGNGDGTFQAQAVYPVGVQPVGIAIADFNGDGIQDITVGNTGQASLTQGVLLGKSDGTFAPQVTFATGNFPYGVAVADFNGDGLPDMAVTNFTDGTATILLSQATETATAMVSGVAPAPGTHAVVASYPGDAHYSTSVSQATNVVVAGVTPAVITWVPTVAAIPYGTALGAQQLDATAATAAGVAIPGTFMYTPAPGTILMAGTQTLSVTFTPTDAITFSAGAGTATITVTQATPVITWAVPTGIAYGTPLSAMQLDATVAGVGAGALPGSLAYMPGIGTVLAPGTQTLSVVFTPTDAVDYTTATASVQLVVGGLTLTSFAPVGTLIGSGDTTITLSGGGFVPTSVVMVNGAGVATTYVSPTTLTAVIPAALLKTMGTLTVAVVDPGVGAATATQAFTVVPPTGAATLSGPATTDPGSQPTVTLSITNPYPLALTAQFSLAFASAGSSSVDDPSIQFSSGGRTFSYDVAANSTSVPPVQLQAGTDAGTITITAKLMADGVDVTPTGLAPLVIVVPPVVPMISGTTITAAGNTLTVVIHGFSNTREVSSAVFDFTAATGDVLATPSVTLPATTIFSNWYTDPTSDAYGSTFTYTQIFNTSADASTVGTVKVTLTNSVGDSAASTSTGP